MATSPMQNFFKLASRLKSSKVEATSRLGQQLLAKYYAAARRATPEQLRSFGIRGSGGASAEYGQTIAALAGIPVLASAAIPAAAALGTGYSTSALPLAASTTAAGKVAGGLGLGAGLLGGGILAALFFGGKSPQDITQTPSQIPTQTTTTTTTSTTNTSQDIFNYLYQTITGSPGSSIYGSQVPTQTAIPTTTQTPTVSPYQSATQPTSASQTQIDSSLILLAIAAVAAIALFSGGDKDRRQN